MQPVTLQARRDPYIVCLILFGPILLLPAFLTVYDLVWVGAFRLAFHIPVNLVSLFMSTFAAILLVWAVRPYRLTLTETGMTVVTPFNVRRSLSWSEFERVGGDDGRWIRVRRGGKASILAIGVHRRNIEAYIRSYAGGAGHDLPEPPTMSKQEGYALLALAGVEFALFVWVAFLIMD
jgi:hypothetical protein